MNKKTITLGLTIGILSVLAIIAFVAGGSWIASGILNANRPQRLQKGMTSPNGIDQRDDIVTTQLTSEQKKDCNQYTPAVTAGPYYFSNTPQIENNELNYSRLDGTKMKVSGFVYGGNDNNTPLANAKIEIWQADNNGNYNPQASGDYNTTDNSKVKLRGYILTNDKGFYEYTSIFPKEYDGRTRHVHYRVSKDGYNPVVTQLTYYKNGDKFPATSDNVAPLLLECQNQSDLEPINGVYESSYNFRIKKQ